MDLKSAVSIRQETDNPEDVRYLKRLAELLNLPPPSRKTQGTKFYLALRGSRLELHTDGGDGKRTMVLCVDFLSGPTYYRFTRDRRIGQPLARAVGIKRGIRPSVLDVTAGLGEDGFVLASLGCAVTLVERSPLIWALLANGISRCSENRRVSDVFEQRVTLHLADSVAYLESADQVYDTIYVDPMYPPSPRSPLNKQKMRLLRELVGDDADSGDLLLAALQYAGQRVVVKRPARAVFLHDREPSFSIQAKSSRYDIYLTPTCDMRFPP